MTTAAAILPPPASTVPEDEVFTIHHLTWEQYVAINDALGDRAGLRTMYRDGSLTFVSPAFVHEWSEDALDKVILAICIGCEIEMMPLRSTTLRQGRSVGVEGDLVYYLHDNVAAVGRPREIDLTIHPPPDLAIEVENTHRATDAVGIYAAMGVPEVWRHDVRRRTLTFWALRPGGMYESIPQSRGFPFLTPVDVLEQLIRADESPSGTRWYASLTDWVRDVIRPRLT